MELFKKTVECLEIATIHRKQVPSSKFCTDRKTLQNSEQKCLGTPADSGETVSAVAAHGYTPFCSTVEVTATSQQTVFGLGGDRGCEAPAKAKEEATSHP